MAWSPPEGLDPECFALCSALNGIEGLETVESCCGHGEWGFYVVFDATPTALSRLGVLVAEFEDWHLTVRSRWDCLLGPVGEQAYGEAAELARRISGDDARVPVDRSRSAYPRWARAVSAEARGNLV